MKINYDTSALDNEVLLNLYTGPPEYIFIQSSFFIQEIEIRGMELGGGFQRNLDDNRAPRRGAHAQVGGGRMRR